jgi:outer membrane protein TolC
MERFMKFLITVILLVTGELGIAQTRNLDYYLSIARSNSPLLKDYQNQAESNRVDSQLIKANYLPQVNGISANAYAPTAKGYGYDYAITNGGFRPTKVL